MSNVRIKVEKLPRKYAGPLKVRQVAEIDAGDVPKLMQSGVVFSITDKPVGLPLGPSVLDQSIPKIVKAIEGQDAETINALLEAEEGGKTRKGVIEALEAALAAASE